ncbi:Glycosyl transferase, family 2 [Sterolibacterium denitrificans]|uniref:Glycosyl transferase, family 2 n=1 Tax=Sterolibacterium denitrificans TaxID=157592 RepID=A0A7Z7HPG5_9PROT|nr:glycosyltransferase family A protein [Sterolibacterium denitrificans]SMB22408.1 Glycosyl transferase, family 2 [Sterolibacterium denitrificans]
MKTDHHPDISVIIPAYNAGRYLHGAIGSVLAQTRQASEIIVIDDGSSDDTARIAAGFLGVRLIETPHAGVSAARNAGLDAARGHYLAFLDADDLWLPTKLERQIAFLLDNPGASGVFGHVQQFVSPELAKEQRDRYQANTAPMPGLLAGALFIKRDEFLAVGKFDEALAGGEFIDWMARAKRLGLSLPVLGDTLLLRRIHGNNSVLTGTEALHHAYLQLIRKKIKSENGS